MDVRFRWDPEVLATLHRQRVRRTAVLQSLSVPVLALAGAAWLRHVAGSMESLWALAPGPVLGLGLLCALWPVHIHLLHARQARKAGRAGAGAWRIRTGDGGLHVEHEGLTLHVQGEAVRTVSYLKAGLVVELDGAHLERVAVPAGEAARGFLHLLGHEQAAGSAPRGHAGSA